MSYTNINELPTEVKHAFDAQDQAVWMSVYNQAVESGAGCFQQKEQAWLQSRELDTSRYVCANVSTQIVDREGDLADVDQYVEAGQRLVIDGGILTKNHSNKVIGTVWKVDKGIDAQTKLPCVVAYMNYFRGTMLYDQSWDEFRNGRTEFSIGSYTKKPERECDMKGCYYRLIPEQWFELSNVDRGINPITYPVEINDEAKGAEETQDDSYESIPKGTIIQIHDDVCPAKQKYMRFKENMKSRGHETQYGEDFILIHGLLGEDELAYVYQEYPDAREFEILRGEISDEDYTLITPKPIDTDSDMLHQMVHLIMDEQEAIQGYETVMESLVQGYGYSEEDVQDSLKILREIRDDEEKHIGSILEVIKILDPDMYSNIAEGIKEARNEVKKGECPAGQHEHAGVWGCHDIFRRHHSDDKTLPTDQLDLTDENIDVNAIQSTPTERLQKIVQRVAKVLSNYGDKQVQEFLSSTPGKEFVLAFLELKRRKMNGENNMTEKEAGCSKAEEVKAEMVETPAEEAEKGMVPDIQSSIANISSTLASITAVIDQMNIRLMKLEDSDLMGQSASQGTSITDAIMNEATGESGSPEIPPAEEVTDEGEDKGEVPPQFEKTDDEADEDSDEDSNVEVEEKTETKEEVEDEGKDDESEAEEESKDDDSKEESKDEEESEDKEETKEESEESESEEEDKKKDEDEDDSEEKKKGTEEVEESAPEAQEPKEDQADVEKSTSEVQPTDAEEPVVEESKQEEPAVEEPDAKVVEPSEPPTQVVEEMELPIPPGGQAVDFRAMLLKRQAELKAKGVELYVAEEGAQNSFATVPVEAVKGTNVSLVRPSNNISAFNADVGIAPKSNKDAWKNMGSRMDNSNFLKTLIGE